MNCQRLLTFLNRVGYYLIYRKKATYPNTPVEHTDLPLTISKILSDHYVYPELKRIAGIRKHMLSNALRIPMGQFGAGSADRVLPVKRIVKKTAVTNKQGEFLFKMARHLKPESIIELGTATGISTLYFALGNPLARVITVEGNPELGNFAATNFLQNYVMNIDLFSCSFEEAMVKLQLLSIHNALIFIDGNHTYEATIRYFQFFTERCSGNLCLIFHDIYWSPAMKNAWDEIRMDQRTNTALDLFDFGIVYNFEHSPAQNFVIRYG